MSRKQWSKSDIKSFLETHEYATTFMDKKSAVADDDGLLLVQNKPCFFKAGNIWVPTLHLLLEKPNLLPKIVVDKGAIRFVINGADIMRPGITAADDFPAGSVVVIVDETVGKPIAVGSCALSGVDLLAQTGGKHVKNLHRIGDEIWTQGTK